MSQSYTNRLSNRYNHMLGLDFIRGGRLIRGFRVFRLVDPCNVLLLCN